MPFELESPISAKITDVIVLADKDRQPDTNPGAGLDLAITTSNAILSCFDGTLRSALYTKNANSSQAQGQLAGVEPISDMPNLTPLGKLLGQFSLKELELTGYTMVIDRGLGGTHSNLELENCKLSNFVLQPKEGGSVVVKLRVESPDIGAKLHGDIAVLKTTERPITLLAPEVQQQDVES